MLSADSDYRSVLKGELEKRCRGDSRYSLRAFARDLKLSPSRLSEIMSGKQGLSAVIARNVAGSLGLNASETELFCDLVDSQHARSQLKRSLAQARLDGRRIETAYTTLQLDAIQVVSEWYHFAILQMITLKDFRNDPAWIGRALAISPVEASSALERLERLGLIESRAGELRILREFTTTPEGVTSAAVRRLHHQILERARSALDVHPPESRDFSAIIMPIDRAQLPEARRWIKSFRRRFCRKMNATEAKDAVYCFSVQLFDLTHSKERIPS